MKKKTRNHQELVTSHFITNICISFQLFKTFVCHTVNLLKQAVQYTYTQYKAAK